jgi:thymidylate synthase
MISIQEEYKVLLAGVYYGGKNKKDRTGTGTRSVFGRTIKHDMSTGFPILTSKKVSFNAARTELLWILQGRTDLKYLEDNGVKYWRPDYERSGRTDGTLGPVYGKQWRDFNGVDQLKNLLCDIKNNPESRRLMVNAWNPADMKDMVLPPCHYGFQVYINDGIIDLMWQQRSVDIFLGLPYDISMYGLLLELLAKGSGLKPGTLIGQLGDCHLYNNHMEATEKYLDRPERALPELQLEDGIYYSSSQDLIHIPTADKIKLIRYNPYSAIPAELSVGK